MAAPPARTSDLVRDSQLRTTVSPGLTHHTYYISGSETQRRRTRTKETWRRGRELGNGTFGRVWLETCEDGPKTGRLRAVKEIPKELTPSSSVDYGRELEAIAKFSHDKYVHCFVHSFGWYESRNAVFIAMEYLQHGDLQKHLAVAFPEEEAKQIASQLAEGLFFMHDNGFAHRDLKPPNILVRSPRPDWWVKISDFGITKRAEAGSALRSVVGTRGYLAPELLGFCPISEQRPSAHDRARLSYTTAVDIWALGEITVRMLAGRSAFRDAHDLFDYVVRENPFPRQTLEDKEISDVCYDFLENTMAPSPSRRLRASDALSHPWLEPLRPSSRASSRESSQFIDTSSLQPPGLVADSGIIDPDLIGSASWSTLSPSQVLQEPRMGGPSLFPSGSSTAEEKPTYSATTTDMKPIDVAHSLLDRFSIGSSEAEPASSARKPELKPSDSAPEPHLDAQSAVTRSIDSAPRDSSSRILENVNEQWQSSNQAGKAWGAGWPPSSGHPSSVFYGTPLSPRTLPPRNTPLGGPTPVTMEDKAGTSRKSGATTTMVGGFLSPTENDSIPLATSGSDHSVSHEQSLAVTRSRVDSNLAEMRAKSMAHARRERIQRHRLAKGTALEANVTEETDQELKRTEVSTDPSDYVESIKPLYLKGLFSVSTKSAKSVPAIVEDITRVLRQLDVLYTEIRGGFSCNYFPKFDGYLTSPAESMLLRFEILVVKVPLLSIHGIQFKKLIGNTWQFKSMADQILQELRL